MRTRRVLAGGIEFAILEAGEGPLVLLLHGFPDDARTWSRQVPALAEAGYRVAAPFMRGYPPTEIPSSGYYDLATLTRDAAELIEVLGDVPARVVGHDWGGLVTYGLVAAYPERVHSAVALTVPHPGIAATMLGSVDQLRRSFYIWFFQLPLLAETTVPASDYELVRRLWADWSPGHTDPEQVTNAIETLSAPGAFEAAIGYYRALFDPSRSDPSLDEVRAATNRASPVSTLALFGAQDGAFDPALAEGAEPFFSGRYRYLVMPECGHFLHRERPDEVNAHILDWFATA